MFNFNAPSLFGTEVLISLFTLMGAAVERNALAVHYDRFIAWKEPNRNVRSRSLYRRQINLEITLVQPLVEMTRAAASHKKDE